MIRGLMVRWAGFHPDDPGSIPRWGNIFFFFLLFDFINMTFKELNFVKLRNYHIIFNWKKGYKVFLNFTYQSTFFLALISVCYCLCHFYVLRKFSFHNSRTLDEFWQKVHCTQGFLGHFGIPHNTALLLHLSIFSFAPLFLWDIIWFFVFVFIISLRLIKLLSQTKPLMFIIWFSILNS